MTTNVRTNRWSQIAAWAVASLFPLGFFFPQLGMWTGPITGVWFVGTQKPGRGFLWMVAFAFVPSLLTDWHKFPHANSKQALAYCCWILLAAVLSVLPFTFHRLTSPRLPGLLSTLPLPMGAVVFSMLLEPLLHVRTAQGTGARIFVVSWFAALILQMWNHEFRTAKTTAGATIGAAILILAAGYALFRHFGAGVPRANLAAHLTIAWICLGGAVVLSAWALFNHGKRRSWVERPETVALLQSPFTGNSLHVVSEDGGEALVSDSGERFPVRDGIPAFLKPEDLTGNNGKYNHLYEIIGGFYDDIQRVFCALKGFDRDAYFLSYMRLLEVKPEDSVLETSVGTGLNFKYLPRGVRLSGLDLSPAMLANCQNNLRRWEMDADLFLCNAESLPFTDSSFDVVFHVGGINFFNDRGKAIREMIRVAKPGSLLLIADETEKHVKEVYEKGLGGLYKNRKEPVSAPVDLVPPEMQEIHLEPLKNGMFYALTFRKPKKKDSGDTALNADLAGCASRA
jgi:ubiquinone/menaquinone biosynthesis C-methylase UbiE